MNIYLLTFASKKFYRSKNILIFSALITNKFKKIFSLNEESIDLDFKDKFSIDFWFKSRGFGNWIWKPYLINKYLNRLNFDDYLLYCDSGTIIVKSVLPLIDSLDKSKQDIMAFELPLIEKQWTKPSLFLNMNCNNDHSKESNQVLASFFLIKKTKNSVKFFNEFLINSMDLSKLTDYEETSLIPVNYYISHRNDQSIFSLLIKKYNYKTFRDPSQYGYFPELYLPKNYNFFDKIRCYNPITYTNSNYKLTFIHSRGNKLYKVFIKILFKFFLVKSKV